MSPIKGLPRTARPRFPGGKKRPFLPGAHNNRRPVWVCAHCGTWYGREKRQKNKPVCDLRYTLIDAAILYAPKDGYGCGRSDFVYFASEGQAQRYMQLRLIQDNGRIRNLQARGLKFDLHVVAPDGSRVVLCRFEPDFAYERQQSGAWVYIVEDYKPSKNPDKIDPVWRHKAAHFTAEYGHPVKISTGG